MGSLKARCTGHLRTMTGVLSLPSDLTLSLTPSLTYRNEVMLGLMLGLMVGIVLGVNEITE